MAKAVSTGGKLSGGVIRVVDNKAVQDVGEIERSVKPLDSAPASRVIVNPASQEVAEIADVFRPPQDNCPRLSNGFRIVRNGSSRKVRKIKRQNLRPPVDNEMEYKKLFTRFEEGFLSRDIGMIGECLSPAFQWRMPNGDVVYGKREALEEMERKFAAPNGPKFKKAVWRFEGATVLQTYEVEYMGADGRWRKSKGFDIYEIGGGLITLKDAYWKMIP